MRQAVYEFTIATRGKGLYEFTADVQQWVSAVNISTGLLTLHIRHTSASLTIQENADPDVTRDLEAFFSRLVPENLPYLLHTTEGPDDMPAHIRSALTQSSLSLPITAGRIALGTWQGLYVFEHRRAPHRRTIAAHLLGE
jgi:secondary thiamine-phosphate synthase enzyme